MIKSTNSQEITKEVVEAAEVEEEVKVGTNKILREVDTVKEVASRITMTINNQQMNIK